ncbi:unnamed protein product [Ceutorhynchus assimilis]|uniref:Uncharacterized protein n=1 Tax=Ceutorhynchus assimilis TaxID=467358 RepID=A0A9N9MKW1_9CUCU|nr:unnamed protein product [Ceutorhynchus assimilis]
MLTNCASKLHEISGDKHIKDLLGLVIENHHKIVSNVTKCWKVLYPAYLSSSFAIFLILTFLTSAIFSGLKEYVFVSTYLVLIGCLTVGFIISHASQLAEDTNENFCLTLYSLKWYHWDRINMKTFYIFLTLANKPLCMNITGEIKTNHEYFKSFAQSLQKIVLKENLSNINLLTKHDHDPTYRASCAFRNCRDEIWAACERSSELLCWEHFINNETCTEHVDNVSSENEENVPPILPSKGMRTNLEIRRRNAVDGEQREVPFDKVRKGNKKKIAHDKRIAGEAYFSSTSGKAVLAKGMKPRCRIEKCKS